MKIIASPANYNEAISLLQLNIDVLVLGHKDFSVRNQYHCDLQSLKELCDRKGNSEIWVKVNAFFYEPQIEALETYLKELEHLKIDRVIFNDYAIPQIVYEKGLKLKLHYDPNTLVTSYGQFEFYVQNEFSSVNLSNELFLAEVNTILDNKPNEIEVSLQCHGFSLIMHSRWNLVTNFSDYIEDKDDEYTRNKILYIREEQRQYSNIIYEDKHGTHMFSGYELCLLKYLKNFYDKKLDYIVIDNILQDEKINYSFEICKIYQEAIKLIKNNQWTDEKVNELYNQCLSLAKDKNKVASGFIGGVKEIKHYENI